MFTYYVMLILGTVFAISAVIIFITMYLKGEQSLLKVGKNLGRLLIGALLLWITLPSLKYVVFKEYDIISGKCVIEISSASSGRFSEAEFKMLDTGEVFTFRDIPTLDAYGKSIPYYCEVTVTKDRMFEVSYKIYDVKTRKLISTGK